MRLIPLPSVYARIFQGRDVKMACLLIAGLTLGCGTYAAQAVTFDPTDPNNAGINEGSPVRSNFNPSIGSVSTVVTNSNTRETTFVDTPSTVTQNNFQVTLEGILNGSQTVYNQTFMVPFTDAAVQNAILQADAALVAVGATSTTSPVRTFDSTMLHNQQVTDIQTGSSDAFSTSTTSTFGPRNLFNVNFNPLGGFFFAPVFPVGAGQLDINVNLDDQKTITRSVVTTNTFLTTQTYVIGGTSAGGGPAVPEPMSLTLIPLSVIGLAIRKRWRR